MQLKNLKIFPNGVGCHGGHITSWWRALIKIQCKFFLKWKSIKHIVGFLWIYKNNHSSDLLLINLHAQNSNEEFKVTSLLKLICIYTTLQY